MSRVKVKEGPGRGGKREGAGRKSPDGAVIVGKVTVSLDELSADILRELGDGNFSLGMRRAMAELAAYREGGIATNFKRGHTPAITGSAAVPKRGGAAARAGGGIALRSHPGSGGAMSGANEVVRGSIHAGLRKTR